MTIKAQQYINGSTAAIADQKAMTTLFGGLIDDIEKLRAALAAVTAKLDADAGVTDTNYTSLCAPTAASMNVNK